MFSLIVMYLLLYYYYHYLYMCLDACVCTYVADREQVCGSASLNPPSHVFKGSDSGHQAFQASPLHSEPSH